MKEHLNPDGSRKKVSLGPGGIEDTAVVSFTFYPSQKVDSYLEINTLYSTRMCETTIQSGEAPTWFHANAVTQVPKREPYDSINNLDAF